MNRILLRQSFGLPADPWAALRLDTVDTQAVRSMIRAAVHSRALVQIVGATGSGKSHATRAALSAIDGFSASTDLVTVSRLDREARTIADIVVAIYRTLGRPRPLGSAEVRDHALRQALGEGCAIVGDRITRRLLLLLDDTHLLHWRTVVALKGLREVAWQGLSPLLGIVMLSQRDTLSRTKEIGQRADTYTLAGLSAAETRTALEGSVARALTPEALGAIADSAGPARTWNDLIEIVDRALLIAQAAGHGQVQLTDAVQASGGGLRDLARAAGISQADLARQTGVSETTVSRILSGERRDIAAQEKIAAALLGLPTTTPRTRAAGGAA